MQDYRFDALVLGLIGLNCVTMTLFASPIVKSALEHQFEGADVSADEVAQKSLWIAKHWTYELLRPAFPGCNLNGLMPCSIAQVTDFIFLILFSVEMLIKMIAAGAISNKFSYFRLGWNWLDIALKSA